MQVWSTSDISPVCLVSTSPDTQTNDARPEHFQGLTSLRGVSLIGTRITKTGVKELRTALPECEIGWEWARFRNCKPAATNNFQRETGGR